MKQNDLFVVNSDMSGGPFVEINKQYPERYVQVGIAEQNMIAVACGLALAGKVPITYSPSPFVYLRAFDQIRNAVSTMDLKVIMIANGIGFPNPSYGSTHFSTEAYNMISLCPNIEYCVVSDETMAYSVAEYIFNKLKRSIYISIDFLCDGTLKSDEVINMDKGWRYINNSTEKDTVIVTQGYLTRIALENEYKIRPALIEVFKKPYNKQELVNELRKFKKIIVAEEHQLHGGLGSEILMLLSDSDVKPEIKFLGASYGSKLPEIVGTRDYIMHKFGVDKIKLREAVDK
jgi:transketolase